MINSGREWDWMDDCQTVDKKEKLIINSQKMRNDIKIIKTMVFLILIIISYLLFLTLNH